MKKEVKIILVIVLVLIGYLKGYTQELSRDKLTQLSYDSILKIEDELDYANPYLLKVFDAHIAKAKILKDTFQLANTYRKRAWSEDFEQAIRYTDSAKQLSFLMSNPDFSSRLHYTRGALFYYESLPETSVAELIDSYRFAKKAQNHELIVDCMNLIASIKREFGEEDEAVNLQEESLDYLKEHKSIISDYKLTYLITLDNLARCYLQKGQIDSVKNVSKEAMRVAQEIQDLDAFRKMGILNAQANYYDGSFIKSRDSLVSYMKYYSDETNADILFYLGKIEGNLEDYEEKLVYFTKIDSILNSLDYPLIDNVKEVYQHLLKNATNNNGTKSKNYYAEKLVFYDSLIDVKEKKIRNITLEKFDLPNQEEKFNSLRDKIGQQKKIKNILIYSLVALALLITYSVFNLIKTNRRLENVMQTRTNPISISNKDISSSSIDIDNEIVNNILEKLENWENHQGFLDSTINQNALASLLDTNSSYLSKIINIHKGQNFSNYLKDLRITFAINNLKENPALLENKSTIQVAEYFGFNSLDVFVRAMKSKIGVTPSLFFKKLKQGNL